jgi:hypothetical protein
MGAVKLNNQSSSAVNYVAVHYPTFIRFYLVVIGIDSEDCSTFECETDLLA